MKKYWKNIFATAPKSVRKQLAHWSKHPNGFFVHGTVGRPAFVDMRDGRRVLYTGP